MKAAITHLAVLLTLTSLAVDAGGDEARGRGTVPGEISTIPFENIPGGVDLGSSTIALQGDVAVDGVLSAAGPVEIQSSGLIFPDGTIQSTAVDAGALSANAGAYANRIPDFIPPSAYTEFCFKEGAVSADVHGLSEPTAGGSCEPGDLGWVIERDERTAQRWEEARATCLLHGMRLPEAFEYSFSCERRLTYDLNDMVNAREWASNSTSPYVFVVDASTTNAGVGAAALGNGSCSEGGWGWLAVRNSDFANVYSFRCVK